MRTASATAELAASPEQALAMFWDLDRWRELWDPIERAELTYQDPCQQEFVMHVERDDQLERVRTVRYRRGTAIEFFSPDPPPSMRRHTGWWTFEPTTGGGTRVRAIRHYELHPGHPQPSLFHDRFRTRLQAILDRFATRPSAVPS
jgi:aromatase